MGDEVKGYCPRCGRESWLTIPGYVCTTCGGGTGPGQGGGGGSVGCGLIGCVGFMVLLFTAFLGLNAIMLIPMLITNPWGPAGSLILVAWLWKRDRLGDESIWLRFGVSIFLFIFIGLLIIAMTHELFELHLMRTAKELLMITLPGIAGGFALTIVFDRLRGKLWPVFLGICLAHTIGKATILGWLMGEF